MYKIIHRTNFITMKVMKFGATIFLKIFSYFKNDKSESVAIS